jgi:hypothetical protein
METGEVDDPIVQQACGVKAHYARRGGFEVRTNFSPEKTARILREAMRANAVSYYLRRGELKLPAHKAGQPLMRLWVLLDSRDAYKKLQAACAASGDMRPEDAAIMDSLGGFPHKNGSYVMLAQFEADAESELLVQAAGLGEGTPTPLNAGHLNWVSLTMLGTLLPGHTFTASKAVQYGETRVEETEEQKREREERQRLAKSGIAGSRSWMAYLAERGQDPPFSRSFVDRLGMIAGDDLHKCTSIVEYLQEAGIFATAQKKLTTNASGRTIELFMGALGMTIGELESKWRTWLLGSRSGVAERIDKQNANAWPPEALQVLEYMNKLRGQAFEKRVQGLWQLKFDPELSEQCALHADYLVLHPEQKKWPDAHEEYADKEGFTVEGAWAGAHSVIVWGDVKDYMEAVDVWMGSFYHRLPLIDPGLLRIGWGWKGEWVVMDTSSLAAPYDKEFVVVWPYDGQDDVPTAFVGNEFPDPVPSGEPGSVNEAEVFGYPVTLQTNPVDSTGAVEITLRLYEGKDGKKEVPCHFSTPTKPTNPELAPSGAWCLIPEAALKMKTHYKVVAEWKRGAGPAGTGVGKTMEWTFKTY